MCNICVDGHEDLFSEFPITNSQSREPPRCSCSKIEVTSGGEVLFKEQWGNFLQTKNEGGHLCLFELTRQCSQIRVSGWKMSKFVTKLKLFPL